MRARERHARRVEVLERAVLALMDGELDDHLRELAESEAHSLAASIGAFGFRTGSRLARALEQSFGAPHTLGRVFASRLADQVLALRHELERPLTLDALDASPEPRRRLHVVSEDPARAEQYLTEGMSAGFEVVTLSIADARDALSPLRHVAARATPAVPLLPAAPRDSRRSDDLARASTHGTSTDAMILEVGEADVAAAVALLDELARASSRIAVLVVSSVEVMELRLAIARCAGVGPLPRTLLPPDVLQRAAPLLEPTWALQAAVLVVDTDPFALQAARLSLEGDGHTVHALDDPARFWETVDAVAPDLVLSGVAMTGISGLDLCRAMRADPRWRELPLVFLAAGDEAAWIRDAYVAGADDVLRKPVDARELSTRVGNRLRRSRLLRRHADADALTGLATRAKGERDLDRFLRLARRHRHQMSLLVFRLDRFAEVLSRHGQGAADLAARWFAQLLQQSFRADDVVTRWNEDDFVVGMFDAGSDDAVLRAREIVAALRAHHFANDTTGFALTCSAGVATFPRDAADATTLFAAADAALVAARGTSPHEALGVAGDPNARAKGRVDVVLVEDDPAIAALVVHALESRQYLVRWLRDGHDAAEALLGDRPELEARLVLLEVNLPAFDGLSLLRSLAQEEKLRHTRVIMLSVRSSEAEVVQAFELGAFDHVSKPFSLSILLERIRRTLAT